MRRKDIAQGKEIRSGDAALGKKMEQRELLMKNADQILEQMIEAQKELLLKVARRIVPYATTDDILQPNDFPELENHPHFRYEEGLLAGLQSAQMALRAGDKYGKR